MTRDFGHSPSTGAPAWRGGVAFLLAATLLFALHDATSKHLIAFFSVPLLVWARYLIYILIMLIGVAPRMGRDIIVTGRPWLMILRALMLVCVSVCFQNALKTLPLAEATALTFVTPLIVALASGPLLGEKVRLGAWLATVAGFGGVLLIARPGGAMDPAGVGYALGTALCYAAYQLLTRKLAASEPPMRQLFYTALAGAIALSLFLPAYWTGEIPTPGQGLLIVSLGLTAGIGQFLLIRVPLHARLDHLATALQPAGLGHAVRLGRLRPVARSADDGRHAGDRRGVPEPRPFPAAGKRMSAGRTRPIMLRICGPARSARRRSRNTPPRRTGRSAADTPARDC
ncbi:DMT family transporter [Propionivibrio sp.]|uniref:DMT family transporter n=1 Tax=Propionivibrio sp. TaxID=2212460 RepID=UPI0039E45E28